MDVLIIFLTTGPVCQGWNCFSCPQFSFSLFSHLAPSMVHLSSQKTCLLHFGTVKKFHGKNFVFMWNPVSGKYYLETKSSSLAEKLWACLVPGHHFPRHRCGGSTA
uniref:Uncharacterized protein n=1 Tax=Setaria viridis TaxID=4556 RepID=A0A4U6UQ38_SETVI|nr:hypothetical protein SEVIR_5G071400v2 [Setaria viridis]